MNPVGLRKSKRYLNFVNAILLFLAVISVISLISFFGLLYFWGQIFLEEGKKQQTPSNTTTYNINE